MHKTIQKGIFILLFISINPISGIAQSGMNFNKYIKEWEKELQTRQNSWDNATEKARLPQNEYVHVLCIDGKPRAMFKQAAFCKSEIDYIKQHAERFFNNMYKDYKRNDNAVSPAEARIITGILVSETEKKCSCKREKNPDYSPNSVSDDKNDNGINNQNSNSNITTNPPPSGRISYTLPSQPDSQPQTYQKTSTAPLGSRPPQPEGNNGLKLLGSRPPQPEGNSGLKPHGNPDAQQKIIPFERPQVEYEGEPVIEARNTGDPLMDGLHEAKESKAAKVMEPKLNRAQNSLEAMQRPNGRMPVDLSISDKIDRIAEEQAEKQETKQRILDLEKDSYEKLGAKVKDIDAKLNSIRNSNPDNQSNIDRLRGEADRLKGDTDDFMRDTDNLRGRMDRDNLEPCDDCKERIQELENSRNSLDTRAEELEKELEKYLK